MACNYPYVLVRTDPIPHVVPVPCGKCQSCRKDRVQMWQDRISFEALTSRKPSTFLTLTYDDKYLPKDRSVHLSDIQRFHKFLRYELNKTYGDKYEENKIRFFAASEYGERRYRPHYHFCITNLDCYDQKDFACLFNAWFNKKAKEPYGIITADGLLPARIRYCVEYINYETPQQQKAYKALGLKPLVHTMSKGIGSTWIFAHKDELIAQQGYYQHGFLRPLPRYYQEKLGMVEVNAYVKNLTNIWQQYNELLVSRGETPINPFDLKDISRRNLLDQFSPECKRSVLSTLIGNSAKELAMAQKQILKQDSAIRIA